MKIEKVNDNQIRCTLTKEDLADRQLKLSELAYGTEKAKSLFRDMMQQAAYEFGFEAEDIPLMIEAIPLSPDCIILIITKVEDPDELDTRFSKFAPSNENETALSDNHSISTAFAEGADDVLDLLKKLHDEKNKQTGKKKADFVPLQKTISPDTKEEQEPSAEITAVNLTKVYRFQNLNQIIRLSHILGKFYYGENTLYKNNETNEYYLVLCKSSHTPEEFNKVCNILSEYGISEKYSAAAESYYKEHFHSLIAAAAVQKLSAV